MFADEAVIHVRSGKGGDGCISFRRAKYVPKGGPDGGNGGDGGSVILEADPNINTLVDFRAVRHWKADHGEPGRSKQQTGAGAPDRVIRVAPGTLVYDDETGELIADLASGERIVVARGGKGGYGNEHFKTATNQAPRQNTPGEPAEERTLRLELKLIADIGLVGLPNAGKSTLLAALTAATPKVADYPFTTKTPQLGIAELDAARRLVLADIPGLIEGAHEGAGMGHAFLRHIERTPVIVHLLDAAPPDGSDPARNYRVIRDELAGYSTVLAEKPEIVALNKLDLLPDADAREAAVAVLAAELGLDRSRVLGLSAATRDGTAALLQTLWRAVNPTLEPWRDQAPADPA